jgi:hypothetical protein
VLVSSVAAVGRLISTWNVVAVNGIVVNTENVLTTVVPEAIAVPVDALTVQPSRIL